MLLQNLGLYFESFNVDSDKKSLHLTVGYAVAQLVEALRYKPEGHEFDSLWCQWDFLLT